MTSLKVNTNANRDEVGVTRRLAEVRRDASLLLKEVVLPGSLTFAALLLAFVGGFIGTRVIIFESPRGTALGS